MYYFRLLEEQTMLLRKDETKRDPTLHYVPPCAALPLYLEREVENSLGVLAVVTKDTELLLCSA
jgi:hypothetical protein